jgi:hypothetical protein
VLYLVLSSLADPFVALWDVHVLILLYWFIRSILFLLPIQICTSCHPIISYSLYEHVFLYSQTKSNPDFTFFYTFFVSPHKFNCKCKKPAQAEPKAQAIFHAHARTHSVTSHNHSTKTKKGGLRLCFSVDFLFVGTMLLRLLILLMNI